MSETFACPSCGAPLDYDGRGDTMRCPYCKNSIIVPETLRRGREADENESILQTGTTGLDMGEMIANAARLKEIVATAREGNKIEAIKQYRELTGVGLKEAKDAVEALMEGRPVQMSSVQVGGNVTATSRAGQTGATMQEVIQLARQGNKIEAIKRYRQITGVGLKEAKDAVEAIEAAETWGTLPSNEAHTVQNSATYSVPASMERERPKRRGSCLGSLIGWVILLAILSSFLVPIGLMLFTDEGPLAGLWSSRVAPLIQEIAPTEIIAPLLTPVAINLPGKPKPLLLFGGEGTGPGKFQDARAISVDRSSGKIYVAEYQGGRVQVFDAEGQFITQWQVGEGKKDTIITSLAADRQGNVYLVTGTELYKIKGETGEVIGQLKHPEGWGFDALATGADGSVSATWYKNRDDLIRFTPQGKVDWLVEEAISGVSGDSELDMKVAVDGSGTSYVLGSFNNAVFVYSAQGKYINRIGSEGDADGQFRAVGAIAVDSQSQVYVSDIHGIQVFAPDGRYLKTIPADNYAYGLAFDDDDNLYMTTNQKMVRKVATK